MENSNFQEAVDLVLDRFHLQGLLGGVQLLEMLEEKAQTPAELALLRTFGQRYLTQAKDPMSEFGDAVAAEGILATLMKQDRKTELLLALLNSGKDERRLRLLLADIWWARYGEEYNKGYEDNPDQAPIPKGDQEDRMIKFGRRKPPSIGPGEITAEDLRKSVYRFGPFERHVVLRKLLSGTNGTLTTPGGRQILLDNFFKTYVEGDSDSHLTGVLQESLGTLFEVAPADELQLLLEHLLEPRMGNPPDSQGSWREGVVHVAQDVWKAMWSDIAVADQSTLDSAAEREWSRLKGLAASPRGLPPNLQKRLRMNDAEYSLFLKGLETRDVPSEEYVQLLGFMRLRRIARWALWRHLTYAMSGIPPGVSPAVTPEEKLFAVVPEEFSRRSEDMFEPLQLVVEVARQMGAPGVRFLQLLGQTVEIPEQYREQFLTVYDNLKGQSKVAAWETIQRELPEYAKQIRRFVARLGGGSLFTVYEVELTNGSHEVVRVLNPNALYHARLSIQVIRDALDALAEKRPAYAQAKPLVTLMEDWISQELDDPSYEQEDPRFREAWNGWKPKGFRAHVVVPESAPTGSRYVRREELVEGQNFTAMDQWKPAEQKEMVALAAQHYAAQIQGSVLSKESQVHSDISPGNLRRTPEGNLAILDRGMYLKFSWEDRLFLWQLLQSSTVEDRASRFVKWLWGLPENKAAVQQLDQATIVREVAARSESRSADAEEAALDALVVVHSRGVHVPLKFTLLFKNLNVFHRMAKRAGFGSLADAIHYNPASAGLEEGVGSWIAPAVNVRPIGTFLEQHAEDLSPDQIERIQTARAQGAMNAISFAGKTDFFVYIDSTLAGVAQRKIAGQEPGGLRFHLLDDLRQREPTQMYAPGIALPDRMLTDFENPAVPVRIIPVDLEEMEALSPAAWVALSLIPNLDAKSLTQGVLMITYTTASGLEETALFA